MSTAEEHEDIKGLYWELVPRTGFFMNIAVVTCMLHSDYISASFTDLSFYGGQQCIDNV